LNFKKKFKHFRNLEKFIYKGEVFNNKQILIITIDDQINSFLIDKLEISYKENIFFNNINSDFFTNLSKKISKLGSLKFDYIFIEIQSLELDKASIEKILLSLKKLCKNGSRIFTIFENKRNIFFNLRKLFSLSFDFKNKKDNQKIISFYNYLLYDYLFFVSYKNFYRKKNIIFYLISLPIYKLINRLNIQRFNFLASHIMIKYSYISY
tara:strand:- start:4171 stop:4797 length:627 start_codon:yes stop_codon:yes gene_type:complete